MIKLSVMYPYSANARFDHDYYTNKHMPLLKERMGDHCLYYTVDKGISGGEPGTDPAYIGMCHVFCNTLEDLQQGFGPHAAELVADIANYTDLSPVMQISEVTVEKSA